MMVPFETCRSCPASKPLQAIAFLSIVFYNTILGPSIATVNKSKGKRSPHSSPFFFSNGNKDFIQSDQQKRHIKMLQKLFKKKKKKKRQVTLEKPQAEQ